MRHYYLDYKKGKKRWDKFNNRFNKNCRFLIMEKKSYENWDEQFVNYDKYQILPLKIEKLIEAEHELDNYLNYIITKIKENFDESYLLERDIDNFYINLHQGNESFIYPPYPHGDYVLFDFLDDNYIFVPPDNIYIYIFGSKLKKIFLELIDQEYFEKI